MAAVRVTLEGQDLGTFDAERFSIAEAIQLEARTGLKTRAFMLGVDDLDPRALQALVWILRTRQGETLDPHSINFAYGDLEIEDEPDPTVPSSGSDDASTSDSSPTSAT